MGCLAIEGRTAMAVLLERGHSPSAVARLLGVTEGTARYHRKRRSADAADGRSKQDLKAAVHAEAIGHWREISRRMAGSTWRRCMSGCGARMATTAAC